MSHFNILGSESYFMSNGLLFVQLLHAKEVMKVGTKKEIGTRSKMHIKDQNRKQHQKVQLPFIVI